MTGGSTRSGGGSTGGDTASNIGFGYFSESNFESWNRNASDSLNISRQMSGDRSTHRPALVIPLEDNMNVDDLNTRISDYLSSPDFKKQYGG